ncbi:hypothetical protein [Nocardia abscessus]|uniref:hypothetical protein n=1 Tax=Nocardia abscessus TaxID=120957 RepID=UPI002456F660|nr:hypothetical protein [Nocardia abscessus]
MTGSASADRRIVLAGHCAVDMRRGTHERQPLRTARRAAWQRKWLEPVSATLTGGVGLLHSRVE